MNQGEGQRRRDSRDTYAPFEVRPAYRRDPSAYSRKVDALVSLLALVVIGAVFGACVAIR